MAILCTVFSLGQSKSMQTTCSNAATGYLINCFAEGDTIQISTTPLYHQKNQSLWTSIWQKNA